MSSSIDAAEGLKLYGELLEDATEDADTANEWARERIGLDVLQCSVNGPWGEMTMIAANQRWEEAQRAKPA